MRCHSLTAYAAGLLTLVAGSVQAKPAKPADPAATTRGGVSSAAAPGMPTLQTVIVTATPMASGVKLLDASFSVTTANLSQIHDAMPSSAADLLKIVPGLWPEASGGDTGANIEIAGFPGGGDAPYVTMQINGSPVYAAPTISFMDNSSLIRLDDTVQRVQVVQGGPSVVYSSGQIGATVNYILRHGTARPHGEIGLTLGTDGLYRLDGFYGGPLAHQWYFSVGGFYRESSGVRRSQFPANQGGQLTATLYHTFHGGNLMFWGRELNDKNLFITDVPVAVSPNGQNVSAFPGFNQRVEQFIPRGGILVLRRDDTEVPGLCDARRGSAAALKRHMDDAAAPWTRIQRSKKCPPQKNPPEKAMPFVVHK